MSTDDDFFGGGDVATEPKKAKRKVEASKGVKPKVGDSAANSHERMLREMRSGEESVASAKAFLHRRANPHQYVYEVSYFLRAEDAGEYDRAMANGEEPKKGPLKTMFSHPVKMEDASQIGDAWWQGVSHLGVTHFPNEAVRNTKPYRVVGKYVAENKYYDESKTRTVDPKVRKQREKALEAFKLNGSFDSVGANNTTSNFIPTK